MPSRCVAAGCSNTTKDGVSLHRFLSDPKYTRIWTTKVKLTRAKWSGPTETLILIAHFEQTGFERGLHSQFGMAYKAMLLPDAIPTISPLCKKAVKAPTKKRGAFLKRERLRVSGHLVILPCITQSTSVQNDMFTHHAHRFHINKTSCLILYPGMTNLKTLNFSHYACACFEFCYDQNFDSTLSIIS